MTILKKSQTILLVAPVAINFDDFDINSFNCGNISASSFKFWRSLYHLIKFCFLLKVLVLVVAPVAIFFDHFENKFQGKFDSGNSLKFLPIMTSVRSVVLEHSAIHGSNQYINYRYTNDCVRPQYVVYTTHDCHDMPKNEILL